MKASKVYKHSGSEWIVLSSLNRRFSYVFLLSLWNCFYLCMYIRVLWFVSFIWDELVLRLFLSGLWICSILSVVCILLWIIPYLGDCVGL